MELSAYAKSETGLSKEEICNLLEASLGNKKYRNVLIIPPDFTRFHSNAGLITNLYYHMLREQGARVDILPAVGTHCPITENQAETMFGDIPFSDFLTHNWRTDTVCLGEVPGAFLEEITDGLWNVSVSVEINR